MPCLWNYWSTFYTYCVSSSYFCVSALQCIISFQYSSKVKPLIGRLLSIGCIGNIKMQNEVNKTLYIYILLL